jgi:hypothetical protein
MSKKLEHIKKSASEILSELHMQQAHEDYLLGEQFHNSGLLGLARSTPTKTSYLSSNKQKTWVVHCLRESV